MFRDLHRDAKLLMASRGIRSFAFSYLNVVFAIYLDQLGYSTVTIGIIFSAAYLSGSVLTAAGGGQGGGPFNPVKEALLAEKCTPENRNRVFAVNSSVGALMGSFGALASGLPQYLQETWGWSAIASYKPLLILTILFSVVLFFVYSSIREQHHRAQSRRKYPNPRVSS
jgi:MFS family permease